MAVVLITHGVPIEGFAALKTDHRLVCPPLLEAFSMEELCALIPDADAVVACGALPAEVIQRGRKLKIIANYGAGYDAVDIAQAAKQGILVTNLPDTVTDATAELALGLMLAVSRRIGEMTLRLRQEPSEQLFGMGRLMGQSLRGRTLGIIGMGRIGKRTAELARALGMQVLGYSRHGADAAFCAPVALEELFAASDIVSLHCPLTPQTTHLLNADRIAQMKPGAILINTSRGAVVDTDALCNALTSGHLSGVGLDVFPDEPHLPPRLLQFPQAVLTPHIGTNTAQTRREMAEACSRQIVDALAGRRPQHIVNGL